MVAPWELMPGINNNSNIHGLWLPCKLPSQNTTNAIKTVIVTFLSHNSDLYWNCETLSEVWNTVNSQLQDKSQNSEIKLQYIYENGYIQWILLYS